MKEVNNVLKTLSTKNEPLFPNEIKDGNITRCKNCGEPTRTYLNGLWFRIPCSCMDKKVEKPKKNLYFSKYDLKNKPQFKNVSFQTSDNNPYVPHKAVIKKALNNKRGIYIFGDVGTGKTHLSICLSRNVEESLVLKLDVILDTLRSIYNGERLEEKEIMSEILNIKHLFIDDLGVESFSKNNGDNFSQRILYKIVENRALERRPTYYTSNYSIAELVNKRGIEERTVDRIVGNSEVIKLVGNSRRWT